ncbi:MAG: HAMP domain-containing sensor histidine kinase [Sulfurovum sp.]|nr:HAMP domain-containing sensor histidine kinase [Sulfurovum sp.]MDD3601834.1 HAMP domain-containing sensor histidine kinase [Sulfurovum sp.]
MLKSEKKSLVRFLLIYLGSTFLLFSLGLWIFYQHQKHQVIDQQRESLKYEIQQIKIQLHKLHESSDAKLFYPVHPHFVSSIYDLDKNYIFGNLKEERVQDESSYMKNETQLYYLDKIEPYYLGAAFLLVSKTLNTKPIEKLQEMMVWFMLGAGVFFTVLGYFLGKLFVAPMRDSIRQMNRFIQDTTHELNTPISTILTNIEMLETFGKCEHSSELQRIEIASKTLSRIYDDLTYLNLNHRYHRRIEEIDVSRIVEERAVFFSSMAQAKELDLRLDIDRGIVLKMDRNDLMRLVDNLFSNAIKYNKPKGMLHAELTKEYFRITDEGIGIKEKEIENILHRFKRANDSEGGFGIGLDIVAQVVKNYGFVLSIKSKIHQGTQVEVRWEKQ